MGTGQKMGTSFPKGKIRQWVQGKKCERLCKKVLTNSSMGTGQKKGKKVLTNSSMGTGQKMGTSLQKGINKFVNGYRAKNGNVFAKRY